MKKKDQYPYCCIKKDLKLNLFFLILEFNIYCLHFFLQYFIHKFYSENQNSVVLQR